MPLTNDQSAKVTQIWNYYIENGERFYNASEEFTSQQLDEKRRELIPTVRGLIDSFSNGQMDLENFKRQIDSLNKRNRLWGFMAINGQMFFNMLVRTSQTTHKTEDFITILKSSIRVPASIEEAGEKISKFEQFVRSLGQLSGGGRAAPRSGSIPYFLSYFWQIQNSSVFPIYYSSMVQALQDLAIWTPTRNVSVDYKDFYKLTHSVLDFLKQQSGKDLTVWDVEHAFWVQYLLKAQETPVIRPTVRPIGGNTPPIEHSLPESYIPPVVSILPKLAINDPEMVRLCQGYGKSIDRVFEERIAILFGMLGFETELLGQGRGRVPDGVAVSSVFRYAIIYDAKIREAGYNIGTDERVIKEYINTQAPQLRHRGINMIYYSLISGSFVGNNEQPIPAIKIETGVNEVNLVEIKALMAILEAKLKNPAVDLGRFGIQMLFASSGVLAESKVREFLSS